MTGGESDTILILVVVPSVSTAQQHGPVSICLWSTWLTKGHQPPTKPSLRGLATICFVSFGQVILARPRLHTLQICSRSCYEDQDTRHLGAVAPPWLTPSCSPLSGSISARSLARPGVAQWDECDGLSRASPPRRKPLHGLPWGWALSSADLGTIH